MSTSTLLSVNQKGFAHILLFIVILLIIGAAIGAFLIIKGTNFLPKASDAGIAQTPTASSADEPQVSLKTEYENPFSEETTYKNPFDNYQNPFNNL